MKGDFRFSASSEEEGDIQETTEQRQHRLAQQRQRHQEETEKQRKCRLEYHRQYNQGRNQINCPPSPSLVRFCESHISSYIIIINRFKCSCNLHVEM